MNVQKLLTYIEMHHIAVVGQVERSGSTFIMVNSLYCENGSARYEIEAICILRLERPDFSVQTA